MEKCIETYKEAKQKYPERWSKNIRNWSLPKYVSLNPMKEKEVKEYLLNNE